MPVVVGSSITKPDEGIARTKGRCRILVADDLKSAADTLAMYFEYEGMETAVAYNGEQAVQAASRLKPEVVCLDIGMPVMDGLQAGREIRKILPDSFMVALTGWGTEEDRDRSRAAGFDLHMVKPVKMSELSDAVRGALPGCFP